MHYELLLPFVIIVAFTITWVRDWWLYGRRFLAATYASAAAAWNAGTRSLIIVSVVMVALASTLVPLLFGGQHSQSQRFLLWSIWSIGFSTVTWAVHPPALLILGSASSTDGRNLAHYLRREVWGNGVLYFLPLFSRRNMHEPVIDTYERFYLGATETRFVRGEDDWRKFVYPLMDLVPVIAIDGQNLTPALTEELKRIGASFRLSVKSAILLRPDQVLMRIASPSLLYVRSPWTNFERRCV